MTRAELLELALPTIPLYRRAFIPSWRVWQVYDSHRSKIWWRYMWNYGTAKIN
jgi:hypothetical protein